MINLPVGNGFSPSRWQVIVNAMLEKIPGKPLLHKLRVIHILEADYNLALKEIFGCRLMQNCEVFGTLGDRQDGFRKGRSTMRTLLQNDLMNDYNKGLRINLAMIKELCKQDSKLITLNYSGAIQVNIFKPFSDEKYKEWFQP